MWMHDASIVVAFTHKSFGIGKNGTLPWNVPEDLTRFRALTLDNVVVMGRKTYESINMKPLPNRFNFVLTNTLNKNVLFSNMRFANTLDYVSEVLSNENPKVFFIGGSEIYKQVIGKVGKIYATIIEKEYECDTFFPSDTLQYYEISEYSDKKFSPESECYFRFVTYTLKNPTIQVGTTTIETPYINLLKDIILNGEERPDRTGVGTLSVFSRQLRFDISKNVPFLTTKQLAWRTVLNELLWFLSGNTNSKKLEQQGISIWKGNTSRDFLDKRGLKHYFEGDTGPLYSHALRNFGSEYKGCFGQHEGFDQLKGLVKGLIEEPFSRRHLLTTFNPAVVDQCVLMPCHGIAIQFYVGKKNNLSCHVYCRSSDVFLGLPFNIASYAILTYIIAKKVDMVPGELIVSTGDTHIYKNHINQVNEQLFRHPLPPPILIVKDCVKNKDWVDIEYTDFEVVGYIHRPAIKAEMAI